MNDENFNMSIRKFLKMAGVGSQREIEQAVSKALASGRLKGKRDTAGQDEAQCSRDRAECRLRRGDNAGVTKAVTGDDRDGVTT